MSKSFSLISGPDPSAATDRGLAWAADTASEQPDAVLCLTQSKERAESLARRWEANYDPLRLTTSTLDEFVGRLYERATGTLSNSTFSRQERFRLVEVAIEQYDPDHGPFSGIESPSNDLIDQVQGLFSLLEYAGYANPDAIEHALRSAGRSAGNGLAPELFASFRDLDPIDGDGPLDEQATAFSNLYAEYTRIRREIHPDWKTVQSEQYLTLLDGELLVDSLPGTIDAVVVDGLTRLAPAERETVARIARNVPTVGVVSLVHDSMSGVGLDAGVGEALEVYWSIGFELDYEEPETTNDDRLAAVRRLHVHPSDGSSDTPDDVGVQWLSPATEREEVRTVARRTRELLARDDVDPAEIGIVVTDRTTYRGILDEVLSSYDIPFTFTNEIGIEQTLVGEALLSLIDLAERDSVVPALRSLCSNPLVSLDAVGVDATIVTRAIVTTDGDSLEDLLAHLEDSGGVDVASALEAFLTSVDPTGSTLAEYVESLQSILADLELGNTVADYSKPGDSSGSHRPAYEASALEAVERVLASLSDAAPYLADTDPAQRVRRAVRAELVRGPPQQPGYVRVMPLTEAEMTSFDHLFVLGLTAGYVPSEQDTMAFFGDVNDAAEEFGRAHTGRRARYILGTLLTGSRDVVLSTPRHTVDGTEHVPAPIVTELQQFVQQPENGFPPTTTRPPVVSGEDFQRAFASWASRERFDSPDRAVEALNAMDSLPSETRAFAAQGLTTAWRRSQPDLTAHDAQIEASDGFPLGDSQPYSPSALEDYARCPFRFLLRRVLGYEEEFGGDGDISRVDRGTYVHDVLAAFYRGLQETQHQPVDLERFDRATLEEALLTAALDRLDDLGAVETPFARRTITRLLAGLGTQDTNPYFGTVGNGTRDGLFARFLARELECNDDQLARPAYFEAAVDVDGDNVELLRDHPVPVETPSGEVLLRGIADRVDVVPGNSRGIHVRDYKTGSTPSRKDVTQGTKLQLPLYGLVLETVLEDITGEPHEMLGGSYYALRSPDDIDPVAAQVSSNEAVDRSDELSMLTPPSQAWRLPFQSRTEVTRFVRHVTPTRLGRIATGIENGAFHPTLLTAAQANCEDCTFKNACDVRHHHQRDKIDSLDRERHYVSERAAAEEFDLATYEGEGRS